MIVTNHQPKYTRRSAFTLLEVLVVVAIIVILAGGAGVYVFGYLEKAREDTAQNQIGMLESHCRNFMAMNGGTAPNSLIELIQPSNGMKPLIDGGAAALNDPWGKQYGYELRYDNYGSPDPYVHTSTQDGRLIQSAKRNSLGQ